MRTMLSRLLVINAITIIVVVALAGVSLSHSASAAFMKLMKDYGIETAQVQGEFMGLMARNLLLASAVAVATGGLLSWFLTRRVTQPLSQMTRAAQAIAHGDYHVSFSTDTTDEVNQLSAAFEEMAHSLNQAETLRRQLVANVGHELRTPLTTVRGYLEALEDGVAGPPEKALDVIYAEVSRLIELVEAIQNLSSVDARIARLQSAGPLPLVSLGELVEGAVSLYQPLADRKHISVEVGQLEGIPPVPGDAALLGQVIHNLLDNALRYTPENGDISVWLAQPAPGKVELQLGNSGPGIPDTDVPHVLERFFRGDRARTRPDPEAGVKGGMGIGLSIVHEAVTAMGGTIDVQSTGNWTTFTCAFRSSGPVSEPL